MQYLNPVFSDGELFGQFFVTRKLEISDALYDQICEYIEQHQPETTFEDFVREETYKLILESVQRAADHWHPGMTDQDISPTMAALPITDEDEDEGKASKNSKTDDTETSADADDTPDQDEITEDAPQVKMACTIRIILNDRWFDFVMRGYTVDEQEHALNDYYRGLRQTMRRTYASMQDMMLETPEKPVLN